MPARTCSALEAIVWLRLRFKESARSIFRGSLWNAGVFWSLFVVGFDGVWCSKGCYEAR